VADAVASAAQRAPRARLALALFGRLAFFAAAVTGAVFILQALLWSAPGDPIDMLPLFGQDLEELRPVLQAEWGLDDPPHQRIWIFISSALQGDLGESLVIHKGAPVWDLTGAAWGRSLRVLLPALAISLSAALALAWLTAGRRSFFIRPAIQITSILPIFLFVCFLVLWDEYTWSMISERQVTRPEWFPLADKATPFRHWLAILVLGLGSNGLTEMHAALENSLVRIRDSGYVLAARARGAAVWPHILRNLLPELISLAASRVVMLIGGLVILEKIFNMNGAGALIWRACLQRDYPLALGLVLGAALIVSAARLAADTLRLLWDPRAKETRA
jgi:peptide/nickel transport system permease protein